MGGQENGHSLRTKAIDEGVHLERRDGIEARRRLVEEHDLWIAHQRAREPYPLTKTLGQSATQILGPVGEVDRIESVVDANVGVAKAIERREVLQILRDAQTIVETWILGHDADALSDLDAVFGAQRDTGDDCRSGTGYDECAESAHGGCFPRAVRTEEPENLAMGDLKGNVSIRGSIPESFGQVTHNKGRFSFDAGFEGRRSRWRVHRGAAFNRQQESSRRRGPL